MQWASRISENNTVYIYNDDRLMGSLNDKLLCEYWLPTAADRSKIASKPKINGRGAKTT